MQTNDKIQTLQLHSCHDIFGEDPGVGSGMIINGLYMPCTHTEKPTYVARQCIYIHRHITCVYIYNHIYIYTYNIYLVGRRQTYTYIRAVDIYIYIYARYMYI